MRGKRVLRAPAVFLFLFLLRENENMTRLGSFGNKKMSFSEFILFQCLTAAVVAHAWLSSINTAEYQNNVFYVGLLLCNLLCLLFIYTYYREDGQLVDYNNDMTVESYIYIIAAIVIMFMVSAVFTAPYKTTAIYVPTFATTSFALSFNFSAFSYAALYNIALVANAEETTKLVGHNALYMYLNGSGRNRRERYITFHNYKISLVKFVAIVVPIAFWACLHAYIAYVGSLLWPLVLSAFVSGIVLYYVMHKNCSVLAAIITHGIFNLIVVTFAGMGWLSVAYTVAPGFLTVMVAFNVVCLVLGVISRKRLINKSLSK